MAFLKELEVISAKRSEMTGNPKSASDASSSSNQLAAAPKAKGKGKGESNVAEETETR